MDAQAQKIFDTFVRYVAEDIAENDNPDESTLDLASDWLAVHILDMPDLMRS